VLDASKGQDLEVLAEAGNIEGEVGWWRRRNIRFPCGQIGTGVTESAIGAGWGARRLSQIGEVIM